MEAVRDVDNKLYAVGLTKASCLGRSSSSKFYFLFFILYYLYIFVFLFTDVDMFPITTDFYKDLYWIG